jgi:hypothetical protein
LRRIGIKVVEVVAVDRADVIEAQFLEQRAAGDQAARIFLGLPGGAFQPLGQAAGHLAGEVAQAEERREDISRDR